MPQLEGDVDNCGEEYVSYNSGFYSALNAANADLQICWQ